MHFNILCFYCHPDQSGGIDMTYINNTTTKVDKSSYIMILYDSPKSIF